MTQTELMAAIKRAVDLDFLRQCEARERGVAQKMREAAKDTAYGEGLAMGCAIGYEFALSHIEQALRRIAIDVKYSGLPE